MKEIYRHYHFQDSIFLCLLSICEHVKTEIKSKMELLFYYKNGTEHLDLLAENEKFSLSIQTSH